MLKLYQSLIIIPRKCQLESSTKKDSLAGVLNFQLKLNYLTASLRALPALKPGTLVALILISSPV